MYLLNTQLNITSADRPLFEFVPSQSRLVCSPVIAALRHLSQTKCFGTLLMFQRLVYCKVRRNRAVDLVCFNVKEKYILRSKIEPSDNVVPCNFKSWCALATAIARTNRFDLLISLVFNSVRCVFSLDSGLLACTKMRLWLTVKLEEIWMKTRLSRNCDEVHWCFVLLKRKFLTNQNTVEFLIFRHRTHNHHV